MFITGVKTSIVEALNAGFDALGERTSNTTLELTPNSVTIEYPLEEVAWPAVFVQFRPSKSQWTGLGPDQLTTISGVGINSTRQLYFEGSLDLQILAMHSEERDRLWDSLVNLITMDPGSPGSYAFYNSINQNNLIALTLLPGTVTSLGDTVSPGTPFSPEELTYEAGIRINCIGETFETKYDQLFQPISEVTVSGTAEITVYPN